MANLEIIVWDDVVVRTGQFDLPLINVFDAVLVQDSPAVQPASLSLAIMVSDNVRVQEGVEDNNLVSIFALEDVTVIDSGTVTFNRLRASAFDIVTVVDAPGVFAGGPVGIVVFENVLVQEFHRPYVSVYINAFDDVSVDDGSRLIDAFDAVTVTEDITVRIARLIISVFDAVTVTEDVDVDGLVVTILEGITIEDIILSEQVTVLLTHLRPESVFDAVTLAEAVTVSLSSINLSIDTAESVTVTDVVEAIQLNPLLLNEFTEVVVAEAVEALTGLLLIDVFDTVTVAEEVTGAFNLLLINVNDEVTVTERVAVRIATGGQSKTSDLPVVGAGR